MTNENDYCLTGLIATDTKIVSFSEERQPGRIDSNSSNQFQTASEPFVNTTKENAIHGQMLTEITEEKENALNGQEFTEGTYQSIRQKTNESMVQEHQRVPDEPKDLAMKNKIAAN